MSLPLQQDGTPITCAQYDPSSRQWWPSAVQSDDAARALKRRYYLVQRARDASIVGIIAGTLSVAGARDALNRVRRLAEAAGKKTYTFVVGKPNPAKLGNFPEVGVFVLVACPDTALLDSRDFLAPVITVFEAELAFGRGAEWQAGKWNTRLDARPECKSHAADDDDDATTLSLVSGQMRAVGRIDVEEDHNTRALQRVGEQALVGMSDATAVAEVTTAAQFLSLQRTYQGLVPNAPEGGDAPLEAAVGQSGRAASYAGEGGT
jgi:diphthamide biosynthesis protein 2